MEIVSIFANGLGIFNKLIKPNRSNKEKEKNVHLLKKISLKILGLVEIYCESERTIISKDK